MNTLGQYISEKLHIDKNINVAKEEFKKGQKIFCFSSIAVFQENDIKIYNPFTFISIKDDKFTYKTDKGKIITRSFFINSNGYIEAFTGQSFAIMLLPKDGIKFLKYIYNHEITKEFLYKYFDKYDEWLDDNPLTTSISQAGIKFIAKELDDVDITEKLHVDNTTEKQQKNSLYLKHDLDEYLVDDNCILVYHCNEDKTNKLEERVNLEVIKITRINKKLKNIVYSYKNQVRVNFTGIFSYDIDENKNYLLDKNYNKNLNFNKAFILPHKESIELMEDILKHPGKMDFYGILENKKSDLLNIYKGRTPDSQQLSEIRTHQILNELKHNE